MTVNLLSAQNPEELRAMLAAITDKATMEAAAIAVFEQFDIEEEPATATPPDGFYFSSDHAEFPKLFPIFNERPPMLFGTVLNPKSEIARAYDPSKPTEYGEAVIPNAIKDAVNAILDRLSQLNK